MNRGQLVARVARKMGLKTTAGSDDLAFLQDLANAAVVEVLLRTHAFVDIGEMTLISGTAEYRLDSNILAVDDGRGANPAGIGNYKIVPLEEMIRRQSAGYVGPSARQVCAFDGDLLIVSPTPADSATVIRFYYVPKPTVMSADSHDPSDITYGGIRTEYHRALEYYMLWQAAEDVEKTSPMRPTDYFEIFQGECKLVRDRRWAMQGRKLAPAQVGYPDSRREPLRNDVYPQQVR
jgi:hypothetical protein